MSASAPVSRWKARSVNLPVETLDEVEKESRRDREKTSVTIRALIHEALDARRHRRAGERFEAQEPAGVAA